MAQYNQYKWNGGVGSYLDPTQWAPAGIPLYGIDAIATIDAGTSSLSNAEPNGVTLFLGGQADPTLQFKDAAFGPGMTVDVRLSATLDLEGYDTNYGTIAVGDLNALVNTIFTIGTKGSGYLNQYGTVTVGAASTLLIERDTFLNNAGLIALAGGSAVINEAISGVGTIELEAASSTLDVRAGVGLGQTFSLDKGTLTVDDFGAFQGRIANFTSNAATLVLGGLTFDAAIYTADASGERLVLTNKGSVVGLLQLDDTSATNYTVTAGATGIAITPSQTYSNGDIPSSITEGTVIIRNAEPNGRTVALGGPGLAGQSGGPDLTLSNAALGPSLILTVASPAAVGPQSAEITVQGYDTNFGKINVIPSADALVSGSGNTLTINIQPYSQLNQNGIISVISPQTVTASSSVLTFAGPGTLNNNGLIDIGAHSFAVFSGKVTGSGTIVVDGGGADLFNAASTQTLDFRGGTINTSTTTLNAAIKNWDSHGELIFNSFIDSVQFNQTSAAGGELSLYGGESLVGYLNLLGTYATSQFNIIQGHTEVGISVGGTFGRPA